MKTYKSGAISALKSIKRYILKVDPKKENKSLSSLLDVCDLYMELYSNAFSDKHSFISLYNEMLNKLDEFTIKSGENQPN